MASGGPALLIGRRVRGLREQAGLSMRALAGLVGVSQPFLSQLERGSSSPSMITIYRLAEALGVTPGALLPDPSAGPVADGGAGTDDGAGTADRAGAGADGGAGAGAGTTAGTLTATAALGVVRAGEGERIPVADRPDAAISRALLLNPTASLEVLEYRISPGEFIGEWFTSAGQTGVYVLEGAIQVEVQGAGSWILRAGDFIYHPGERPHRWLPVPGATTRVLLIAERASR